MRTLCILCLIYGVQAAALKGLLHKRNPNNDASLVPETDLIQKTEEPPVFVVSGLRLLVHDATSKGVMKNSDFGRRHQWASAEDHKAIKGGCQTACGKGVDATCVPECQVKLYGCLDYDRKTKDGAKEYKDCETRVLDTYTKFGKNWEATHPYTTDLLLRSKGEVSTTEIDQAQDECVAACGKGVDTSCVPECQVRMYTCLDHDQKVPEGKKKHDECKEDVLKAYRNFAADWEATHPYLLAVGRHTSAKDLNSIRDLCVEDCNSGESKSCSSRCQTSLYTCLHLDATKAAKEYAACTLGAKKNTAKAEAEAVKSDTEVTSVVKACTSACGLGADASCLPECEVQMYACSPAEAKKYTACTQKVLTSYEKLASDWNVAHPFLLAHRGHADAETLEEMQNRCQDACGDGVDTSCVPECQVKLYTCLDHDRKVEKGAKKYKKCTSEVLATYEKFADDWDATHPYLLAVHRHVSTVELSQVVDKCVEACGVGVDTSCLPECQVEMYSCLDHNRATKDGAKAHDECEKKVVAEYKDFGKNWDEVHPYGNKE